MRLPCERPLPIMREDAKLEPLGFVPITLLTDEGCGQFYI